MIGALRQNRYRVHDILLAWDAACKVLNATGLGSAGRARLLREAQALARSSRHIRCMASAARKASPWSLRSLRKASPAAAC